MADGRASAAAGQHVSTEAVSVLALGRSFAEALSGKAFRLQVVSNVHTEAGNSQQAAMEVKGQTDKHLKTTRKVFGHFFREKQREKFCKKQEKIST